MSEDFLKMPTEKIKKQFPDIFNTINEFVLRNNSNDDFKTFKQKVYNYINNIKKIPVCSECGKNNLGFKGIKDGYAKFCSVKCKANSDSNKQNVINTLQTKHGIEVTNVSQLSFVKEKKENTYFEKYGTTCSFDTPELFDKAKETWKRNYDGLDNPSKHQKIKKKISVANKLNTKTRCKKASITLLKNHKVKNMAELKERKKESIIEKKLCEELKGIKKVIKHKEFDIFLVQEKVIIEVDGTFYHPFELKNLCPTQIVNVINDIDKEKRISNSDYKLYRINSEIVEDAFKKGKKIDLEFIILNSYTPNRSFDNIYDVVTKEEILKNYNSMNNKKDFKRFVGAIRLLLKYIKGIDAKTNEKFLKNYYDLELKMDSILLEMGKNKSAAIQYADVLCSKSFLKKYSSNDKEILIKELEEIFVFIRNNIKNFLYPQTTETLFHISNRLKNAVNNTVIKNKTFKSYISNSGIGFLKSFFKSYFHSSYKGKKTPVEYFNDDNVLFETLSYRIGYNKTNETFDISFKEILKGFSAMRRTISFFKPGVAALIYKTFLEGCDNKVVFDPCCGFGGRMLGFFIQYPDGQYIGCEPNPETFSELLELKKRLSDYYGFEVNCKLYNKTLEEFIESSEWSNYKTQVQFTFTSIPYYDLEIYSKDIVGSNYVSFDDWKQKFISCFYNLPNCYINMPTELYDQLKLRSDDTYYLKNHVARHLNKKDNEKLELIVKIKK